MGEKPSSKHTIERQNNDRGYEAGNCCWATLSEQMHNQDKTLHLTHAGQTMHVSEWAALLKLNVALIKRRLRLGWSLADALDTPKLNNNRRPARE